MHLYIPSNLRCPQHLPSFHSKAQRRERASQEQSCSHCNLKNTSLSLNFRVTYELVKYKRISVMVWCWETVWLMPRVSSKTSKINKKLCLWLMICKYKFSSKMSWIIIKRHKSSTRKAWEQQREKRSSGNSDNQHFRAIGLADSMCVHQTRRYSSSGTTAGNLYPDSEVKLCPSHPHGDGAQAGLQHQLLQRDTRGSAPGQRCATPGLWLQHSLRSSRILK